MIYYIRGGLSHLKKGLSRYVLTDEIYTILKEKILNHVIAAGDKINIDQLGRDLEVSNIPIREALSRLTAEGFVDMVPFKGMFVAKMSLLELDEMFEIRMQLECLALHKAILKIPDAKLEKLNQDMNIWTSSLSATNDDKIRLIAAMNESLHGLILEYSDNNSLKNLVDSYIEKIQRYLSLYQKDLDAQVIQAEWNEHMTIIHFLIKRASQSAEEALMTHLQNSHARTRNYFS